MIIEDNTHALAKLLNKLGLAKHIKHYDHKEATYFDGDSKVTVPRSNVAYAKVYHDHGIRVYVALTATFKDDVDDDSEPHYVTQYEVRMSIIGRSSCVWVVEYPDVADFIAELLAFLSINPYTQTLFTTAIPYEGAEQSQTDYPLSSIINMNHGISTNPRLNVVEQLGAPPLNIADRTFWRKLADAKVQWSMANLSSVWAGMKALGYPASLLNEALQVGFAMHLTNINNASAYSPVNMGLTRQHYLLFTNLFKGK